VAHALGDRDRLGLVDEVLEQDRELVAAEAGGGVLRAQRVLQGGARWPEATRRRPRGRGRR
jgi:hypothetical protein